MGPRSVASDQAESTRSRSPFVDDDTDQELGGHDTVSGSCFVDLPSGRSGVPVMRGWARGVAGGSA